MEIDDKLDRLASVIQALSLEVGRTRPRAAAWHWYVSGLISVLSVSGFVWQQVYFAGKLEARRQADIEFGRSMDKFSKRFDAFMKIGPPHQDRMIQLNKERSKQK